MPSANITRTEFHSVVRVRFAMREEESLRLLDRRYGSVFQLRDVELVAFAYGHAASGDVERARGLLSRLTGDGSAAPADLALVEAFLAELSGDHEGILATFAPHLNDRAALHPDFARLRSADALMALGRFAEVEPMLAPLLKPPGTPGTLEAQFIFLDALLRQKAPKDRLVEILATVDVLVERGHRLTAAGSVVYYAMMMEEARLSGVVEPLLAAHDDLFAAYALNDREAVRFLLVAGERAKAPEAVRASGRGYVADPFPWTTQDPEKVCYLYASHEAHDAAALTIETSFSRSRIAKSQALWGPLILEFFGAGRWKHALDLVKEHRNALRGTKIEASAHALRAICEFQLGRYDDMRATWNANTRMIISNDQWTDASAIIVGLLTVGRFDEAHEALLLFAAHESQEEHYFFNLLGASFDEFCAHDDEEAIDALMASATKILKNDAPGFLFRCGVNAIDWSLPACTVGIAALLEEHGDQFSALLLRARAAASTGCAAEAHRHLATAKPLCETDTHGSWLEVALFAHRRLQEHDRAQDLAKEMAAMKQPRYMIHGLANAVGLAFERNAGDKEIEALFEQLDTALDQHHSSADQHLLAALGTLRDGPLPSMAFANLKSLSRLSMETTEPLRLSRYVVRAFDATDVERTEAALIGEEWKKNNIKRPVPSRPRRR